MQPPHHCILYCTRCPYVHIRDFCNYRVKNPCKRTKKSYRFEVRNERRVRLLIFELFSRGDVLNKEFSLMFFNFEIDLKEYIILNFVIINTGGYVYSRGYVYYFIHILQGLHLFSGLRLFRTPE